MRKAAAIIASSLLVLSACNKVPSHVIQPREMAELMADVHVGEAVVEYNRSQFYSDSMKQAMKQSIYLRHGVTTEEVDSSFAWYGRNITYYMDVYDRTIEILEKRLIETGNRVAAENALSIAGDSVDVWPNPRYISINDQDPSRAFTFSFSSDPNWERGDTYTWRAKFFNAPNESSWLIAAEYADGFVEYVHQRITGDGWKEIRFQTDSARTATRIFGYFSGDNRHGTAMSLDSMEMVRKRIQPGYYRRPYTATLRNFNDSIKVATDSIAAPADSVKTQPEEGK